MSSWGLAEMRFVLLILIAALVAGCDSKHATDSPPALSPDRAPVVDMHTSRTSLNWPGAYEGLLACADCAGIHTQLTLNADATYELVTRPLVRGTLSTKRSGQFEWQPDGNTVVLDSTGDGQRFAVGEGRLTMLDAGQSPPVPARPGTVLMQWSPHWRSTRQDLVQMIEDHRWMLLNATDATNRRIDALFPDAQQAFAFSFAESRLHVQGGCNGLRGGFQVGEGDTLSVTGAISTMMACDAPLMEADAAVSKLLAEPLDMVLVRGTQPTLVLVTSAGDALLLTGELTPEARYGAPATVFLEIDAQTVECAGSSRDDGMCLQVRDLTFDDQGLRVGTPGEWRAFTGNIEGYQHEPGISNVLRVKRFQAADGADADSQIFVLDLVVESRVAEPQ